MHQLLKGERSLVSWMLPVLIAVLAGLLVYINGTGGGIERALHASRDSLRVHSASGRFVLVEIDAKSLRAIDDWPWPRSVHARALQKLEEAGASTIAFDVDFSSHSTDDQDARFAAALNAASVPVVLPTFRQYASQQSKLEIESLPLAAFRKHAQLAAVNIFPDDDGIVRSYPSAVITGGVPRPSIGAMLASATGRAGNVFPLDTAIDPATIPHISYIDLLNGDFPRNVVNGKNVLIGASAIELGDRYPVSGWGVISGPAIQLMAAETLRAGSSPVDNGPWLPLCVTLILLIAAIRLSGRRQLAVLAFAGVINLALPLGFEALHWGTVEIVPPLVALLMGGAWIGAADALAAFNRVRETDHLSGLPNRRPLEHDLDTIAEGKAVVVARIGGYADLASLLGPARGAELILRVVDRLQTAGIETVYRIEESTLAFVSGEPGCMTNDDFFRELASVLQQPVEIAGRQVQVDVAFGYASRSSDRNGAAVDHALLAADQAQEHGRLWEEHSQELAGTRDWRLSLVGELDSAMASGDLWVAFQPKLDITRNQVVAAEALVRWSHPERGNIFPDSFIPQLEKNGRILDLTLYVLDRAMEQAQHWRLTCEPINVAVNVSAPLLTKAAFIDAVRSRMETGRLIPELLTFEVTESASMENPEQALEGMRCFASMGINLSIDDYGTGQSTLSYLKHLPASEIKIDKSFVLAIADSKSDQAMVRSTIALAHELGFAVVAEGIENEAVLNLLREMRCDYAQGWHIGRPVPAEDFPGLIKLGAAA